MRLLCFQAKRFAWRTFEKTLETAESQHVAESVTDAVVAFVHVEAADVQPEREASVTRQAIKHLKWLANKRGLRAIVLHSFAHLGGDNAPPAAAQEVLHRLAQRLIPNGYSIRITPFGYSNEWELEVFGEGSAKVWKEI
jgi:hypothetical protein